MIKVSPSILACDFANLQSEIKKVEDGGAQYLHIDVMDGIFVPNITLGPCIVSAIRKNSNLVFDVHLMITDPIRYIDEFAKAGADLITIHVESTFDVNAAIDKIKANGKKVGLSIKPNTKPEIVKQYLDKVDLILVMTVEPGFGGQSFIPATLDSIRAIDTMIKESGKDIELEVDGGISPKNVQLVKDAGANVIVAGSAVFGSSDIPGTIAQLMA
ncbi:MAG: ribulose-phosphate 3-epimerase [Ruminococcaceae bacterium]|nr:ribulose-phosphate 3-epimerase [Oscillospiraceae bacterium]